MWHIYTMEYYSAIKRNKIELFVVRYRERQISYDITYTWNIKKMIQMSLFTKQKETHRHRKQTYG